MQVAVFSTKPYDRHFLEAANQDGHGLTFHEARLTRETTALAHGFPAVSAFVNDTLDAAVVHALVAGGTRLLSLRSTGFNNVDLEAAAAAGLTVMRVPGYSPYSVAEHTVGLMLALNRKLPRAAARVREGNFALDGLLGFDMHGRTAGVIGTGRIGTAVARILSGFGCRVLAHSRRVNPECAALGVEYVELPDMYRDADIITLHCPLVPQTWYLIDQAALEQMQPGVMLINTSRGGLLDTAAVIEALKSGQIGYLGLDVYEEEEHLFFRDLSGAVLHDDVFARLLTFPNVLITGHQAFFTHDALTTIAEVTLANISAFERGEPSGNEIGAERVVQVSA